MTLNNYNFNIDELYDHFKFHNSDISKNGIIWITTLCKGNRNSYYHKIIFDFGIEAIQILISYFESKEEYEICQTLQERINKHKEITV